MPVPPRRPDRPPFAAHDPSTLARTDRLIQATLAEVRDALDAELPEGPEDVRAALAFIHERLFRPGTTATSVHDAVGSRGLRVRLRGTFGMGVRDYIEGARLYAACRLIRHADVELYRIADAVGYEHYETFCRAFKRAFRRSPSDYRTAAVAPD